LLYFLEERFFGEFLGIRAKFPALALGGTILLLSAGLLFAVFEIPPAVFALSGLAIVFCTGAAVWLTARDLNCRLARLDSAARQFGDRDFPPAFELKERMN
jgi:hypothetical protein